MSTTGDTKASTKTGSSSTTTTIPGGPALATAGARDSAAAGAEVLTAGNGSVAAPPAGAVTTAPVAIPVSSSAPAAGTAPAGTAPATAPAASASTASAGSPAVMPRGRRVRLTVSHVDPWSAMKMSFLISVAMGVATVVMVFVLWTILSGMGVFDQIDSIISQVQPSNSANSFSIKDVVGLGRVLSLSVVIAVLDVVIWTAMATLGAFLYNVCSALVGGLQLTLTDD